MSLKIAILSTVGTSLLSNIERNLDRLSLSQRTREVFGNRSKPPSRLPIDDELQELFNEWASKGGDVLEDSVKVLSSDPVGFSAELNAIVTYIKSFPARHVINELRLQFYPTDTGTSRFSAMAIVNYLRRYGDEFRKLIGVPVNARVDEPIILRGFGRGAEWFREGLSDLMDKFVNNIVSLRRASYKVVVNPTGGFKPESAYLTVMAMLAGAWRVIYVHETFRDIIELPMLPITINPRYAKLLSKNPTTSELMGEGLDPGELEANGIAEVRDSEVIVKEWFKKLIQTQD